MPAFTINDDSVIQSLDSIREALATITKKRDELAGCLERYKTAFVDEISERSAELVSKIDEELDRMNQMIDKYAQKYKEIMHAIGGFREVD